MGFDWVPPDLVFALMSSALMAAQVLPARAAAAGFSNTGVLTVMALFVVAEGVSQTGALDAVFALALGRAPSAAVAQARLMLPVLVASAFLNNTPIVALLIPLVRGWARRNGVPAKQLLIPLSFAAVLGGTITTIGTSTNLAILGLQQEKFNKSKNPADAAFGIFTLTPYGIPYALWGAAYIVLFSHWLLPRSDSGSASASDLASALAVPPRSPAAGRSIGDVLGGGDVRATALARAGRTNPAPPPGAVLLEGDVVYVTGPLASVRQAAAEAGLAVVDDGSEDAALDALGVGGSPRGGAVVAAGGDADARPGASGADLLEVRVKKDAPLIGTSIKGAGFRGRFGAAVVGVRRAATPLSTRFGDVVLAPGDFLVLAVGPTFAGDAPEFRANFDRARGVADAAAAAFSTALAIPPKSKLAGKTIQEAGLRGVQGLYLFAVERAGKTAAAAGSDVVLQEGDVLWFAGDLDAVAFLRKVRGLVHTADRQVSKLGDSPVHRRLVQAAVSAHSPLCGHTLRGVRFRHRYGAAVLAIHRAGVQLATDVAGVALRAGDVLVLEAGPAFAAAASSQRAFAIISEVPGAAPLKKSRMWLALAAVGALILSQILAGALEGKGPGRVPKFAEKANLWYVAMLAAATMLAGRCLSIDQARASLDWQIYVCIGFAFGISTAMESTGVAKAIAEVAAAGARAVGGRVAALTGVYLVTSLLSELLTNNAAGVLMYPLASTLASELGIEQRMMSIAIMLGASAGWILPWSYQCNLMVFSAGNYATVDFVKIGLPMYPWLVAGTAVLFAFEKRLWIPNVAAAIAFILSLAPPLVAAHLAKRKAAAAKKGEAAVPAGWEVGKV